MCHDQNQEQPERAAGPAGAEADHVEPLDPRALGLTKAAYSVREAASLLSIGRSSLYETVKRRDLRPVKLGRRTLFLSDDLAAFLRRLGAAT